MDCDEIMDFATEAAGPEVLTTDQISCSLEALREKLSSIGFLLAVLVYQPSENTKRSVLDLLDRAFRFPDYFGWNWDAVDECLMDLQWLGAAGYCSILFGSDELRFSSPSVYEHLIDAFRYAAETWRRRGIPFKLILAPKSSQPPSYSAA